MQALRGLPIHQFKIHNMEREEIKRRIREWWDYAVSASTEEDRAKGKEMFKLLSEGLTPEERKLAGALHREYLRERAKAKRYGEAKCEDFNAKEYINDIEDFINFSAIAKEYFGKDRAWLHQRINGSIVNGKKAAFTEEEKKIFIQALKDISARISDSIHSIH